MIPSTLGNLVSLLFLFCLPAREALNTTEHRCFTPMSHQGQAAADQGSACDEVQEGWNRSVTIIFPIAKHHWHLGIKCSYILPVCGFLLLS